MLMDLLKKLFTSKETITVTDYASFWKWFVKHEKRLFRALKEGRNIEAEFIEVIMPALQQLNPHFYVLAGIQDGRKAKLVISAEGRVRCFVFVEELIASAPKLTRWKFSALKPPAGVANTSVEMGGYKFSGENMHFISNEHPGYPDEIDLTVVHPDYTPENRNVIFDGIYIFFENALGELNVSTLLDGVDITGPSPDHKELISMDKLESYLSWRRKEFVEKYKDTRDKENKDQIEVVRAKDAAGIPVIAIVNHDLMMWDGKPSYPWMMQVMIEFEATHQGLPNAKVYRAVSSFEEQLLNALPASCLDVVKHTYNGRQLLYIACQEFRDSSKAVATFIEANNSEFRVSYNIFKDKYWRALDAFIAVGS